MQYHHSAHFNKQHATVTQVKLAQEFLQCQESAKFYMSCPDYILESQDILQHIQAPVAASPSLSDWLNQARAQLQQVVQSGFSEAKIVGGLTFSEVDSPELMICKNINIVQKMIYSKPHKNFNTSLCTQFTPHAEQYQEGVQHLIHEMQEGRLNKAVLARLMDIEFEQDIEITKVVENLMQLNPEGYSYALATQAHKTGWFVGASPELLIAKQDVHIWSQPVAGTQPRSHHQQEDQANAQALLHSAKDHKEHRVVIEMIADQLAPFCKTLTIPSQPSLIKTNRLWHLATKIDAQLKSVDTHIFELVGKLHPTPAVCGQPPHYARQQIAALEPFQRELFAGAMGWADAQGNGNWSVTVRCARLYKNLARLFAGAGIVSESDPLLEHQETAAKFRTMLDGLGLEHTSQ